MISSILNSDHTIDSERFTDLLTIAEKHSDYLKSKNVYNEICQIL